MKKGFVEIILVVLLVAVSAAFAYYYGTQKKADTEAPTTVQPTKAPQANVATPTLAPFPTSAPVANIPAGWKTYTNTEYGFQISYPPSYQALTDSNSLYGWPDAVVLFYGGGQSYDLAVERWSTQTEYENKYKNQTNITVKKIGGYYITLLNTNFEAEVDSIIETFIQI